VRYPGRRAYEEGLARALIEGQRVLRRGGRAVRAVTAAVRALEDDPLFNAGRGAVLCADGSIELSAAVMDGHRLRAGAMAGLKRTKNPVLAAHALLKHRHGLLFGEAGDTLARQAGLDMVPEEYFVTTARVRQWRKYHGTDRISLDHGDSESTHGTVGAVARDSRGNLAAATSTGGLVNQLPGRIGDSPVIGAGTWADRGCAVSATGTGDAFARIAFARRIADLIEFLGLTAEEIDGRALEELESIRGTGGCILVDAAGRLAFPFNSAHMLRGWVVDRSDPVVAILPGERVVVTDISARTRRHLPRG
jgi:isoaspartyl peptidase/L-asparaginase-like protein (Ntn-hydrolase superfamily)